jgi:hypothetical protein
MLTGLQEQLAKTGDCGQVKHASKQARIIQKEADTP